MAYLIVYTVAEFCALDDDEIADLSLETWTAAAAPWSQGSEATDWARVAAVSVEAVHAGVGDLSPDEWAAFGRNAGLTTRDLFAFESLHADPLCVTPDEWINGRHRGCLIRQSGASHVAVVDLEWRPTYLDGE